MGRAQTFVSVLMLIVLVSLWYMEGPRIKEAYGQVMAARKEAA